MKDRGGGKYFKCFRFQSTCKPYYHEQKTTVMFFVGVMDFMAC